MWSSFVLFKRAYVVRSWQKSGVDTTIDDLMNIFRCITKNKNYYLLLLKKWDFTTKKVQKNALTTLDDTGCVLPGTSID